MPVHGNINSWLFSQNNNPAIFGGESYCDEYQTVYDSFTTPPSDSVATAQNTMVSALVDAGVWDKLDVFYLFAQESNGDGEALKNWVNPGSQDSTLVNAPGFVALEGFTGNGTSSYINTNYNPASHGSNYKLDDAMAGIYIRTDAGETKYDFGAKDTANYTVLLSRRDDDAMYYFVNTNGIGIGAGVENSRGVFIVQREDSANQKVFFNKELLDTEADASKAIIDEEFYICCYNKTNVPTDFTTKQYSAFFAGGSLTTTQIESITDAIEVYMDSNSKGIILSPWAMAPHIYLPPTSDSNGIPVIVGEETTIYGDTLCNLAIENDMTIEYTCDIGSASGNDYVFTPVVGDVGLNELTIVIKDDGVISRTITTHLNVLPKVTEAKSILMIGDSLIYLGVDHELSELESILSGLTLTTIGTQTLNGYDHEGRSGWRYRNFVEEGSPFVKSGSLNISAYFTDNALATPDFVYLRCGVNDANGYAPTSLSESDLQNHIIDHIDTLVDGFLAFDANLKIIVGTPSISTNESAKWDAVYDDTIHEGKHDNNVKVMHQLIEEVVEKYRNGEYDSRVFTCYAPIHLDRGNYLNALHPNDAGYTQLGVGLAATLNKLLQ